jgi:hypothetical protein
LIVERNGDHDRPVRLDGSDLKLLCVTVNGQDGQWRLEPDQLVIDAPGERATIETEVEISPAANTRLMGLYAWRVAARNVAEGFRRITFFPDRPDVLSKYSVRMEADGKRFPILLERKPRRAWRGSERPSLGRVARSISQTLLPVRARRRRPEAQPRHVHDHERPQGGPVHLGTRSGPSQNSARDEQP